MPLPNVLLVDDEPFNYELIKPVLAEHYEVQYASCGEECIAFVEQHSPRIILLDVEMPGMDGFEICRAIKASEQGRNIPVTFVSAKDSVEERLKGYEVGAEDYVTKPFCADELRNKIGIAITKQQEKDQLQQSFTEAMGTAMTAMTSAGELGVVLQFFEKSFASKTIADLAERALEAMSSYGLLCTLYISDGAYEHIQCTGKRVVSSLEQELMQLLRKKQRIFDFGARTIINYKHISLLIKNMPLDDPDRYGRIKDNVAILVEGAESRIRSIMVDQRLDRQQKALSQLVDDAQKSLHKISENQQNIKKQSVSNMEGLMGAMEELFMSLGLTEEQEQSLLEVTQGAADRALALYEQGREMDQQFSQVIDQLKHVISH